MVRGKVPGAGRRLKRLCKWDGLSSDAQHTSKKSGMSMHACNPSRGKQVPGTHWPASLNSWIPDALRDPVSKESHKNYDGDDEDEEKHDWGRYLHTNTLVHLHTCTCQYIHAHMNKHITLHPNECTISTPFYEEDCPIHLELFSSHPLPSCKYSIFWYNLKRITFIFCSSLWLIAGATAKSTNLYP